MFHGVKALGGKPFTTCAVHGKWPNWPNWRTAGDDGQFAQPVGRRLFAGADRIPLAGPGNEPCRARAGFRAP
jgi:hypothetical protein